MPNSETVKRLALVQARRIADAVLAKASANGVAAAVAVVNEYGTPVQIDRMDNAPPIAADIALARAMTALNLRARTSELNLDQRLSRTAVDSLRRTARFDPVDGPGGCFFEIDGRVIGAVGVSGSNADWDEALMVEGVKAI